VLAKKIFRTPVGNRIPAVIPVVLYLRISRKGVWMVEIGLQTLVTPARGRGKWSVSRLSRFTPCDTLLVES
jgi:hypothetical protein